MGEVIIKYNITTGESEKIVTVIQVDEATYNYYVNNNIDTTYITKAI